MLSIEVSASAAPFELGGAALDAEVGRTCCEVPCRASSLDELAPGTGCVDEAGLFPRCCPTLAANCAAPYAGMFEYGCMFVPWFHLTPTREVPSSTRKAVALCHCCTRLLAF